MLELQKINFKYNDTHIFNDFNLKIPKKQHTAIVGKSGSGKSTLLKLICGLESIESGTILKSNKCITKKEPCKRKIGMLFQDYALFPHMSVRSNILFANKKADVEKLLKIVELEGYENRYPHELSGGQMQRVALSRVLATNPDYILLDEPFANYDVELKHNIRMEIKKILDNTDTTLILVSHDLEDANILCDTIVQIDNCNCVEIRKR